MKTANELKQNNSILYTEEERQRRIKLARLARASLELEGFTISEKMKNKTQQFIDNKISFEEFMQKIKNSVNFLNYDIW